MESQFKLRYEGQRWSLVRGSAAGIEQTAFLELQRVLQYFLPYVLPVPPQADADPRALEHVALVGTPANSPHIAGLIAAGHLKPPTGNEGYSIALMDSPFRPGSRLLAVAGTDSHGVLYGVQEVNARLFEGATRLDGRAAMRHHLEKCPLFAAQESPAVPNRGIWSWGYAIYSYRRFIDHMMRLKMNMLTVWNDHVPLNARDIITYAHERGVQVVFGFHWGWGHEGSVSLTRSADRRQILESVVQTFRTQYAPLNPDGIYFQTLTEHHQRQQAGRSTAAWACDLVNEVSAALLAEWPSLKIQFGLHGISIREDYVDLRRLDDRVTITWEDCGSLPFNYQASETQDFEATVDYAKRIAAFRPGNEFAMTPKGWLWLRWEQDFENHGPFVLGERSDTFIRERLGDRQNEWDVCNTRWFRHYPLAARFYRELLEVNPRMTVTGLVEDGLFEERIQPSVALFAETLWNPRQSDTDLLARAMRPYCTRV